LGGILDFSFFLAASKPAVNCMI